MHAEQRLPLSRCASLDVREPHRVVQRTRDDLAVGRVWHEACAEDVARVLGGHRCEEGVVWIVPRGPDADVAIVRSREERVALGRPRDGVDAACVLTQLVCTGEARDEGGRGPEDGGGALYGVAVEQAVAQHASSARACAARASVCCAKAESLNEQTTNGLRAINNQIQHGASRTQARASLSVAEEDH